MWGILVFVSWLVKKMPLITGGGIPQTRGVINGRVDYKHPFLELVAKFVGGILALSTGLSLGREGPSVQIDSITNNEEANGAAKAAANPAPAPADNNCFRSPLSTLPHCWLSNLSSGSMHLKQPLPRFWQESWQAGLPVGFSLSIPIFILMPLCLEWLFGDRWNWDRKSVV